MLVSDHMQDRPSGQQYRSPLHRHESQVHDQGDALARKTPASPSPAQGAGISQVIFSVSFSCRRQILKQTAPSFWVWHSMKNCLRFPSVHRMNRQTIRRCSCQTTPFQPDDLRQIPRQVHQTFSPWTSFSVFRRLQSGQQADRTPLSCVP